MFRLLMALPIAVAISIALFSLMAWMVDDGNQAKPGASEQLSFTMMMVEPESEIQRRQRSVPEQPKPLEQPPETKLSQSQSDVSSVMPVTPMSSSGLDTAINGLKISAPTFGSFKTNQQAMPLYRVEPKYPSRALKRRIEGYVIMSFSIDETGKPFAISVQEAKPKRLFDRDAMRALKQWKYQPKLVEGKAIIQQNQTVRLEFKLAE
ncbi:energy transducer TonB [Aliivibrio fischeri]|uniref:energy transducer TonB n=1 Tax=Aliivibrio fischeri TaxID=668 RepID=UPI00084C5373|nr:energy transducer TonB [Aliivibrio fischeri]OED55853.1 energy transducer TonB [Aliivibrio fischeri]